MSGPQAVVAGVAVDRSLVDDLRPLLAALLILIAWDATGLDLPLARLFGDANGFAWRNHWLTSTVMHDGARVVAWLVFGALVAGVWQPMRLTAPLRRRERIWWLGTTLACLALIPLLKRSSLTSCPWELAEFGGGAANHVSHWLLGHRDGGPGGCFPSGHASTAFGFLAGFFALRGRRPQAARIWLCLSVGLGLAFGWVQMMRGAHYASHSLWTGWICWAVTVASFHLSRNWRNG